MKKSFVSIFLCILLLTTFFVSTASAFTDNVYLRIYLSSIVSITKIYFQVNGNYVVAGKHDIELVPGERYKIILSSGGSKLELWNSTTHLTTLDTFTFISSENSSTDNYLIVEHPTRGVLNYTGDMYFYLDGGILKLINRVYVENYLVGVIDHEMIDGWPIEALKAQAVSARTFAFAHLSSSNKYDMIDTTTHQVYYGYNHSHTNAIDAVNQTKGKVITYNGSLASVNYSASNGGQTISSKLKWGGERPYLTVKDDPYDRANVSSPHYDFTFPVSVGDTYDLAAPLDSLLKEGVVTEIAKQGIIINTSDVTIDGIYSLRLHTQPDSYPVDAGTYRYQYVNVTAKALIAGISVINAEGVVDIPSGTLPIFSEPNVGSEVVGNLEENTIVHIISEADRWLNISAEGFTGYVYKAYIDYSGEIPKPTPSSPPQTTDILNGTTKSTLNVRNDPSTNNDALGQVSSGTKVVITEILDGWYKIDYDGGDGYVSADFVSVKTGEIDVDGTLNVRDFPNNVSNVLGKLNDGDTIYIIEEMDGWVKILYGDKIAFVSADYVIKIVSSSSLISSSSVASEVILSFDIGTKVIKDEYKEVDNHSFLKYSYLFYVEKSADGKANILTARGYGHGVGMSQRGAQTMADPRYGFNMTYDEILLFYYVGCALTDYDTTERPLPLLPTNEANVYGIITADGLNVRSGPAIEFESYGTVSNGERVRVLEPPLYGWYRIETLNRTDNNLVGYVSPEYITIETE